MPGGPQKEGKYRRAVTCTEAWHWPEFKAFAKRLGVVQELPTQSMTIRFDFEEPDSFVNVSQQFWGNTMEPM